jgi:hypothetical protein
MGGGGSDFNEMTKKGQIAWLVDWWLIKKTVQIGR